MTAILSFISDKGGVGKTAAAILLAGEYALQGKSVLVLDADSTARISRWYEVCRESDNEPDGITVDTSLNPDAIGRTLQRAAGQYDVVIVDAPGKATTAHDEIIAKSDLVLTPVQPGRDEMDALATATETIASVSDQIGREVPQVAFMSAIKLQDKSLLAYKTMHSFVQNLANAGYAIRMLPTELTYRNIYREIRNGLGTLQMQTVNPTILKARNEVASFTADIDTILNATKGLK